MSWVCGVYSKTINLFNNDYSNLHEKPLQIYQNKKYYIAVGGFLENIMVGETTKSEISFDNKIIG